VSLDSAKVPEFRERFAAAVASQLAAAGSGDAASRDIEIAHWLRLAEVTDQLFDDLELLQPFGEGNAEPVFGLRGVLFDRPATVFGEGNFRHQMSLGAGRRLSFVAWRMADRLPPVNRAVELAVRLQWNRWQGRRMPQAEILDWRPA
ncbi:MAG: single-stranded-DNA-specific exonuclease RecJ, partial [Opitutia bacterium]